MGEGGRLWVAQMLGVGDNDHKAHKPLHTLARCGFGCLPRVAAVCVAKTPKARGARGTNEGKGSKVWAKQVRCASPNVVDAGCTNDKRR